MPALEFCLVAERDLVFGDEISPDPVVVLDYLSCVEVWAVADRVRVCHHHHLEPESGGGSDGCVYSEVRCPSGHQQASDLELLEIRLQRGAVKCVVQ